MGVVSGKRWGVVAKGDVHLGEGLGKLCAVLNSELQDINSYQKHYCTIGLHDQGTLIGQAMLRDRMVCLSFLLYNTHLSLFLTHSLSHTHTHTQHTHTHAHSLSPSSADSWPDTLLDSAAREILEWTPKYDLQRIVEIMIREIGKIEKLTED